MSKVIGFLITGVTNQEAAFVILEGERVKVGHYYFIKHPIYNSDVLLIVHSIQPYNPEMVVGRPGILTAQKGIKIQTGRYLESHIAYAEMAGYFDGKGKWRQLEVAPDVGAEVYQPTEEELDRFFRMAKKENDCLYVEIGKVHDTNIPVYLDLNVVAKSHILVAGMTRAGKSSFIVNLAVKSTKLNPRPRLIIFDRRREYGSLTKYPGVRIVPYNRFIPLGCSPRVAAKKLGLEDRDAKILETALNSISAGNLSREELLGRVKEEAQSVYKRESDADRCYQYIEKKLSKEGSFLFEHREVLDILEEVEKTPTLIIDFSTDGDIESQHLTAANIFDKIMRHAMARRGDFAVIICVEEAQYFAPEKGLEIAPSIAQDEVKAKFIEAISQAGGYNVGLVVMTQRPAYVAKSVISQCNSVACFRLKSGNDQNAILNYTEQGSEKYRDVLPGLADHEVLLWGLALHTPFPVVAELTVDEYPQKAIVSAKQAWQRMTPYRSGDAPIKKPKIEEHVAY
ncbi:MAG: ATP-binding protein [Candidatus Bathyarchaeia archaeon]